MVAMETVMRRLRSLFRRAELEREMDEELRHHLELERAELSRDGLSEEEARRQALVSFGGVSRTKEEAREARGLPWLEDLVQDVRYALRGLARTPGFTAAVVVTLALAIGANATMFGIVDRLLLRGPEHVRDPGRVRRVYSNNVHPVRGSRELADHLGYVNYQELRDGAGTFLQVAAFRYGEFASGQGSHARMLRAWQVTWDFFPLLGVEPAVGRFFLADEDRPPSGQRVLVLDHGFWRRQFGGDPGVIGRQIDVAGNAYTVVGVAPGGFTGVDLRPVDVWLPMNAQGQPPGFYTLRRTQQLRMVARLRPGASFAQAGAAATLVYRSAMADVLPFDSARIELLPLFRDWYGRELVETSVARWLAAVAAVVLLIACANIANLLLARSARRRSEIAVRLALGVARARLLRLLLVESVLLALAGGAAALAVAYWGGLLLRAVLLPNVAFNGLPIDWRVLAFTASAALGTGVLFGLTPALQASRMEASDWLKSGSLRGGASSSGFRTALVLAQSALAFPLLVGAALFVQSLRAARAQDLGLEAHRVVAASITWPSLAAADSSDAALEIARREGVLDEAIGRLRRQPWVERASFANAAPFLACCYNISPHAPGQDTIPRRPGWNPYLASVGPDYFATVGMALVRGRPFLEADGAGSERVTIVSRGFAQALWPAEDALGQCLVIVDSLPCARVVGVVGDAHQFRASGPAWIHVYVPIGQGPGTVSGRTLLVRPRGPHPERAVESVRRTLWDLQSDLPFLNVRTLDQGNEMVGEMRPWRLGASLFTLFGLLALVVTVVGLYSVIAYVVEQRNREFAVRIALGARARDVFAQTLRRGLAPAVLGLPAGVAVALLAGRFVEPLLFETSARDVRILGLVALVLLLVSAVASLIPAVRAMRVDPVVALQAE